MSHMRHGTQGLPLTRIIIRTLFTYDVSRMAAFIYRNCPYDEQAYAIWPLRLKCASFHLASGSVLVTPDVVTASLLWWGIVSPDGSHQHRGARIFIIKCYYVTCSCCSILLYIPRNLNYYTYLKKLAEICRYRN
jgi:hypothetical protein